MIPFYLWLNAGLYLLLALWCTVQHGQTSRATGFVSLDNSGHSEYLVINGGLQLGLAFFYGTLAMSVPLHATGLLFSLLLYTPIVAYRVVTVLKYSPVGAVTLGTGALELVLLLGATLLYFRPA